MIVEAKGLRKRYNHVWALDGLDLAVQEGEIYGLLGPNGSGKTTTILILLGLTEPTAGTVRVCGYNPVREPLAVKRVVGYLSEKVGFYEELSARENLQLITRLNGIPDREAKKRIEEALEHVGLADVAGRPVATFSHGMRQRLGIADVLVKKPRLAILDEPTSGIDPEGAVQILDLIKRLRDEAGMTIILSSHLLYQVQRICDRVGILQRGRMVAEGTVAELVGAGEGYWAKVEGATPALRARLEGEDWTFAVEELAPGLLQVALEENARAALFRIVAEEGAVISELRPRVRTLEEIYLRYFQE
ncbi:MAG: ABC transporter ATP-binding protein [Candidatus Bipolaricaulota bacterium]|nr:ABC transporter ATP-binding protein [Candidatus Bipolaricaulota bacterium]MDW8126546.1 ABC transporter ATP-binding protein [Candidatus Bipolaricaulota bacterium]